MVWEQVQKLLSSPELIKAQAKRWLGKRAERNNKDDGQVDKLENELGKVRKEEQRYLKAYGLERLTLEQLEGVMGEIKVKKVALENQIKTLKEAKVKYETITPTLQDIDLFAEKTRQFLVNPSFSVKRKLIEQSLDKIVATQSELHVTGFIPLGMTQGNIEYESLHRHRRFTKCRQVHAF
jgi:hypothetical protein